MRLTPKNWREFQHYKERTPPWIRLHRKLLDDKDFHRLPIASRALAPMLWLLASEAVDGTIDMTLDDLAFRLRTSEDEIERGLSPLIERGFFFIAGVASTLLAPCQQLAPKNAPEAEACTEACTEAERDIAKTGAADLSPPLPLFTKADANSVQTSQPADDCPECPHQDIIAAFHKALPSARRVRDWTPARATLLKARWREDKKRQKLEWWVKFFTYVGTSDFLMGRAHSQGRKPFELGLEWLVKAEHFAKVREGAYHSADEGAPA